MLEIQRVLCPIDFSDASRHALGHPATIGHWGSHITALHVGTTSGTGARQSQRRRLAKPIGRF